MIKEVVGGKVREEIEVAVDIVTVRGRVSNLEQYDEEKHSVRRNTSQIKGNVRRG